MPATANEKLIEAAKAGDIQEVRMALYDKATDFDSALAVAAFLGHIDIVELMLEKGADNLKIILIKVLSGRLDKDKKKQIIRLFTQKGLVIDTVMFETLAPVDMEEITYELLNYEIDGDITPLAMKFAENGRLENIKMLLDKHGHKDESISADLSLAEELAADMDPALREEVLAMVKDSINDNYFILSEIMKKGIENNRLNIVKYAVENGVDVNSGIIKLAKQNGFREIISYLETKLKG